MFEVYLHVQHYGVRLEDYGAVMRMNSSTHLSVDGRKTLMSATGPPPFVADIGEGIEAGPHTMSTIGRIAAGPQGTSTSVARSRSTSPALVDDVNDRPPRGVGRRPPQGHPHWLDRRHLS